MIRDIFLSQDLNTEYRLKQHKMKSGLLSRVGTNNYTACTNADVIVKVLSADNWPLGGII